MAIADWLEARDAYDRLASHYDQLTADYDHHTWLAQLLQLAAPNGPRVLDIACGTGKSFAPLIGQGYEISACDISSAMLRVAREHFNLDARRMFKADMRRLPDCGPFDLITCLDDAVNYLRTPPELLDAFTGVAGLLASDGVFVFDTNTLGTYRRAFAGNSEIALSSDRFRWRGMGSPDAAAGCEASAVVERIAAGTVESIAVHRQRHHTICEVKRLLAAAGLTADMIVGQRTGCDLRRRVDDLDQAKTVFVARPSHCGDARR